MAILETSAGNIYIIPDIYILLLGIYYTFDSDKKSEFFFTLYIFTFGGLMTTSILCI